MESTVGQPLSPDGIRIRVSADSQRLFEKNRDGLIERYPGRVDRLRKVNLEESRFLTFPVQRDQPCLIGFRPGSQLVVLDDPSDPEGSHCRWFENFRFDTLNHAILLGFGAGHIRRLLAKPLSSVKKLVVIEPNADLLAVACATYDLSETIRNPQVSVWAPEDGYTASLWTEEWLEGFDRKQGDHVGFLLNPFFLRSAPEFFVEYLNWLRIKDDKFFEGHKVLEDRFPPTPGLSDEWEWGIGLTGVGALKDLGKGLMGVVVAGADLTPEEKEFLESGYRDRRLVFSYGDIPSEIHPHVDGFVIDSQRSGSVELQPHQQLFAEFAAASRHSFPASTVIFRTEKPPQRDQIVAPLTTLGTLKRKGTLVRQPHPAGTLIDLCRVLGVDSVVLMGATLGLQRVGVPDFGRIALSRQILDSSFKVYTLSPQTADWLDGVSLVRGTDLPRPRGRKKISLSQAVEVVRNRPPSLPAPQQPMDRTFRWAGQEVVTQAGLLREPREGNLLEILFRENLESLRKTHPEIARIVQDRMANPAPIETYRLGKGPEGFPHLSIVRDGKTVAVSPLTSNPWKDVVEAHSWEALFPECANLVVGVGLAFHIEAILERTSGRLMIWEPVVDRLMAAMHVRNLRPLFESDRLDWVVGKSALEAAGQFVDTRTQQMYYHPVNWEPYVEPGMRKVYAEFVRQFLDAFRPRVFELRAMRNEAIASAKRWAVHFLRNAPRKAEAASLGLLRDRFKGVPAIIVSAGPSLDQDAPLLNEVRDRALIFVVDTAFRVVCDREIDRHFVVTVDQKEATLLHFADRTPRETDVLIATSGAPPKIWDFFDGPVFFGEYETGSGDKSKILSWISESLGMEDEYLFRGNSVAISSIGAARILGCDPIILIGQDLSVLPERTHAEGTIYPVRSSLEESAATLTVPAIGGGEVPTTQWLKNIQNNLEYTLVKYRLNVINATSRGARIRGTREIPFREVLDRHLGDPVPVFDRVVDIYARKPEPTVDRFRVEIDRLLSQIDGILSRAGSHLKELYKLRKRIERDDYPEDCPKRFRLLQQALIDIGLEDLPFQRVQDFVYREANTFSEQHVRVHRASDPKDKLRFQVERTIPLLESLAPGMNEAKDELRRLKEELGRRFGE